MRKRQKGSALKSATNGTNLTRGCISEHTLLRESVGQNCRAEEAWQTTDQSGSCLRLLFPRLKNHLGSMPEFLAIFGRDMNDTV